MWKSKNIDYHKIGDCLLPWIIGTFETIFTFFMKYSHWSIKNSITGKRKLSTQYTANYPSSIIIFFFHFLEIIEILRVVRFSSKPQNIFCTIRMNLHARIKERKEPQRCPQAVAVHICSQLNEINFGNWLVSLLTQGSIDRPTLNRQPEWTQEFQFRHTVQWSSVQLGSSFFIWSPVRGLLKYDQNELIDPIFGEKIVFWNEIN